VHHDLEVIATDELAQAATELFARLITTTGARQGACTLALSGGHTPWSVFGSLARRDLPWEACTIYQVDERAAPDGDPDRNLTHLEAAFGDVAARVVAMDAADPDLPAAAARYAAGLPAVLDVVHLGLGPDGHTASLVPGDGVLEVTDVLVAPTTRPYQGHRRLTLTYPALARARQLVWLVTGATKQAALAALLAGDTSIPAGRVHANGPSVVLADAAATSGTPPT
jgi:6-phosphogluconolactonase